MRKMQHKVLLLNAPGTYNKSRKWTFSKLIIEVECLSENKFLNIVSQNQLLGHKIERFSSVLLKVRKFVVFLESTPLISKQGVL